MRLSTCRDSFSLVGIQTMLCFLCAAWFVAPARASAQEADWQLRKEQGGIRVFTREQQGSNFAAVRAEMILEDVRCKLTRRLNRRPKRLRAARGALR